MLPVRREPLANARVKKEVGIVSSLATEMLPRGSDNDPALQKLALATRRPMRR